MPGGRPKGSLNKKNLIVHEPPVRKKAYNINPQKICCSCPPEKAKKSTSNFYRSKNKDHADGFYPMCTDCVLEKSLDPDTKEVDVEALKRILRQVDRPFLSNVLQSAANEYVKMYPHVDGIPDAGKEKLVAIYFKNIQSLPQYSDMSWQDGDNKGKAAVNESSSIFEKMMATVREPHAGSKSPRLFLDDEDDDFQLQRKHVKMFGRGFTKLEYKAMQEKYDFLIQSYPDVTNLHTEALCTYIRYKVKEEFATAAGDVKDADSWGRMAMAAADKAKINPSQLRKSDLQGGLNSISELFLALEQAVDIVPILPQFKYRPNDAADFIIWCYINYGRKMEGKPQCSYADIYRFYDERKAEYVAQYGDPYGIFKDDPTEKNRSIIEKFVVLPEDNGTRAND